MGTGFLGDIFQQRIGIKLCHLVVMPQCSWSYLYVCLGNKILVAKRCSNTSRGSLHTREFSIMTIKVWETCHTCCCWDYDDDEISVEHTKCIPVMQSKFSECKSSSRHKRTKYFALNIKTFTIIWKVGHKPQSKW